MSFDIDKIGSGEWFPFMDSKISENGEVEWLPVDPECGEKVCFRQLGPDRYREIHDKYKGKKTNIPVKDPDTREMKVVGQYEQTPAQEKGERMECWDEQIVDWNITTPDGKAIPCTAENKYKLIVGEPRFLRYANKCIHMMSGVKADEEKEKIKNLPTGSSSES
jgi:hypothetical protein